MKTLADTQTGLKALIPQGIDVAIKAVKAALAPGTDKYNDLILLEGRYQDATRQLLQGIVSDEDSQVQFNKIRKDLLDFIDSLQAPNLASFNPLGADGMPDIYNGEVLYRIPNQMQKEEETRCLVRLAFDRAIIVQDLEMEDDDVLKDLRISEVMGVELLDPVGKAFRIRTLNDTVQFLEKDLYSEWIFYVTPLLEGIHDLVLKISIIEIKDGIERKRNVVLEEKVEIIATVPEKIAEGEYAKAGVAISIAGEPAGLNELPQPAPPGNVRPYSPAPSPQPHAPMPARGGAQVRKVITALSAMLVLLVASYALWNKVGGDKPDITTTDPTASIDEQDWNRIKDKPTYQDVKDFMDKHPNSPLVPKARTALDSLDNQAWESALASNDIEQMREYVRKHPNGINIEIAAMKIAEMEKEDAIVQQPSSPEPKKSTPPSKNTGGKKNTGKKTDNKATNTGKDTGTKTPPAVTDPPKTGDNTNVVGPPKTDPNAPIPMDSAARLPVYPGCKNTDKLQEQSCTDKKIGAEIKKKLKYPGDAKRREIEGTIKVEFIVEKDGKVTGVQYLNDIGGGCAAEAVRLVKLLPQFEPGLDKSGKPVRIKYILPISFKLR